ncbi:polysaccharide deacetylase family protein [Rhodohalobacter sp. SW132]|uniref:polysaccharide deacetylase family protein n=1 Tax=Rhodohalobacter sp. SW132 TaxID=2293433 RepID=UPI000E24B486|nr:polysaccharide deacetylase family protein [Rhodohalobacter sp. SW132]REL24688.1 polysaccharide deacetylase family protein [Rhodohalobacter sp. SW132]
MIYFITFIIIGMTTASPIELSEVDTTDRKSGYYIDSTSWKIKSSSSNSAEKIALITIDDGPKAYTTPVFLDLLDEFNAKALFFINGYLAEPLPWVVRQILDRGHKVGNHSWSHARFTEISSEEVEYEITSLNNWLESELNYQSGFFRAPYGVHTPDSFSVLEQTGLQNVGWSVNSYDWQYPDREDTLSRDAKEIADRTLKSMKEGNIILLHDRAVSAKALRIILEELSSRGYRFVLPD